MQKTIAETWELTGGECVLYTESREVAELALQAGLRHFGVYLRLARGKEFAAQFKGAGEAVRAVTARAKKLKTG